MMAVSSSDIRNGLSVALGPAARLLTGRAARILMYHRFAAGTMRRRMNAALFEQQIRYVARNFLPQRLQAVVERLRRGHSPDGRSVVVTVDDGYRDFLQYAYPILVRYRVPATLYVVSEFVDGHIWLWPDAVQWILGAANPGRYHVEVGAERLGLDLAGVETRNAAWLALNERLLQLPPEELWAGIERVEAAVGATLPAQPTAEYASLRWKDLQQLDPDLIEIGAHTCTHPILSACSQTRQRYEVATAKQVIEERLGRAVEAFCYPNGEAQSFTAETRAIVEECGFTSAVVAFGGLVDGNADLFRLERLAVDDDMRLFRNCVNGIGRVKQVLRRLR